MASVVCIHTLPAGTFRKVANVLLLSVRLPQPQTAAAQAWLAGRLVTRLTIEERMMQQTKKKMVLEHLVVHKMNTSADLKQVILHANTVRNETSH